MGLVVTDAREKLPEHRKPAALVWRLEPHDLVETAPQRRVERLLVVGGGDEHTVAAESVHELQDAVDHALELAVLTRIVAAAAERVKLVEQDHPARAIDEVEQLAQVRGSLPQVGGDERVEPDVEQR